MHKRQVPMERDWLRRYLRDCLEVSVPMHADDEAWQRICDDIPASDWIQMKNAWYRHRHNDTPRYLHYVHAADEAGKRLGLFWQRLISQGFITEENAILLAENFFQGSGGYSDERAKDMVRIILHEVASRCRDKSSANRQTRFGRRRTDLKFGSAF